jgi:hypothetical protein
MAGDNPLADRGRSLEQEFFRKRDQELIEKMRKAAAADEARRDLSAASGLQDPELLQELELLGFTRDTVSLLPLVPLIQVAWAEGTVSDAERRLLTQLARSRGITEHSAADLELDRWLSTRPSDAVFSRATRLVQAILTSAESPFGLTPEQLVKYCEDIAAASGGIFGINRISAEERALLMTIAAALKQDPAP